MVHLKVLIFTDNFLPSLGGVERHTYTLSRYLSQKSFEVHVATSRSQNHITDEKFDKYFEDHFGVKITRPLAPKKELPFLGSMQYLTESRKVTDYLNRWGDDYDIVHYHGSHQMLLRFLKIRTPVITSLHGIFAACIWQSSVPCQETSIANCAICDVEKNPAHVPIVPLMMPYYHSYYTNIEKSLRNLPKVICVSDYVRDYIKGKIHGLNNLETVHNFIDFAGEIKPELESASNFDIRRTLGLPSSAKLITYFGRLSKDKGVDLLLSAFNILRHKVGDNVYLLIGGAGPERVRLEQMAQFNKNVVFLGILSRKLQITTMAQSDIFVHPARYPDACPTTILEATALGLPVVATKLGGIPEIIIDGQGGYLVKPDSAVDLAAKIYSVIQDNEFRSNARTFNLQWSQNFDIRNLGMTILKLYNNITL